MHPDLYALVLRLGPADNTAPPRPQGHGAHALFLDLLRQVDANLARQLHADAPSKPFTVAIVPGVRSRSHRPHQHGAHDVIELRVTLMHSDLFAPFTHALLQQTTLPSLRLGNANLILLDVLGTPGSHAWAGYSSCAEVWATTTPVAQIELEFATATAISQGTRDGKRPRLEILPGPEAVFKSIARRWNDLAPAEMELNLDLVEAAARDSLITRYNLSSTQISLGKGPQKGFVGRCTYELPDNREYAHVLTMLANAVFYLGVGSKTARGMGLCRRLDSVKEEAL